jgi:alpha-mannosidase
VDVAEDCSNNAALIEKAYNYNHTVNFVSGRKHGGILGLENSFMKLEKGTVAISAVKMAEASENGGKSGMIVRVYETSGAATQTALKFANAISNAWFADINENKMKNAGSVAVAGNTVNFEVNAGSMATLYVEFQG